MKFLKRTLKFLTSRFVIISFLILIQLAIFVLMLVYFERYSKYVQLFSLFFSFIILAHILYKEELATYKIPWIIIILLLPLAGSISYILYGSTVVPKRIVNEIKKEQEKVQKFFNLKRDNIEVLKEVDESAYGQAMYIGNASKNILYNNSSVRYFKIGEKMFEEMLMQIKSAKEFIFLEYFIISEGIMWDTIHELLKEKVKEGVEVRIIYDDVGSIKKLKYNFRRTLRKEGIKCVCFNPFKPVVSNMHNNRDHRKLLIIDGIVGFTGGINIADEYINKINKFGHWKDGGIMIQGESVSNMTIMFLKSWNVFSKKKDKEFTKYFKKEYPKYENCGYTLMFGDSPRPNDNEYIGENTYLNIINQAKKNVYIMTPYFIVDHSMINALVNAKLRGVDVRVIVPYVPDKKIIYMLTKANYTYLVENGIKVYEYKPGFIHSKLVLADNEIAVNGTINFDYRSFVHHYECACWMYKTECIEDMYNDFSETINVSEEIKVENLKKAGFFKQVFIAILKFFAPLF